MSRRVQIVVALVCLALAATAYGAARDVTLPDLPDSCRFAVIGDSGTGGEPQHRIAARMAEYRKVFRFDLVLMLGDNVYGTESAADMARKFERPYRTLLDAGVEFRAALGNHDDPSQAFYRPFNMKGERYYTYRCGRQSVRFFVLDSNYMTPEQIEWLDASLGRSNDWWKIAYFHHPIYSTGMHGPDVELRKTLEPLFVRHGVDVVFSGHEHFYQRLKPQHGVRYFVSGAAAKLRRGDIDADPPITAKGYDRGYHFMVVEIAGDAFFFQAVADDGTTVDAGTLHHAARR
jgi:hypothetical protein